MKLKKLYEEVLKESIEDKIIAYHGTDYDINRFSDSFLTGDKVIQHHGAGIYFATNYENARMFGKNVYKVELIGNFISENNPTSDADSDKLIELMKLSDDDEWELEAQNYHPDPEVGLMVALEDALDQPNEAHAYMRIQNGWYNYNGLGYVRSMSRIGIDGVIVNPPEQWVGEKHIIMFNPNAIKFIKKMPDAVEEELTYRHANTEGPEDDEYEIGMVKEEIDMTQFRFNDGKFNKSGANTIYMDDNPIIDFGVGELGQIEVYGKLFNNSIFLKGGFNASEQAKGYGTIGLEVIFRKLPKIQFIILECLKSAKGFWDKMGGEVVGERPYVKNRDNSPVLYTMVISRDDFLGAY